MVADMLGGAELVAITTTGDRVRAAGDKSRFVKEIEEALLAGDVDVAVHSAKDVPGELPDGLVIASVPPRADPRDVVCGAESIASLPPGARVGTASVRRRSQLLSMRDDLEVVELRGNVDTRLRRLDEGVYDAVILAAAGLARLGRHGEGVPVGIDEMTPAPGQGCLALEIRGDDDATRAAVERVSDPAASACLAVEREFVIALDATCDTPVGAFAEVVEPGRLRLRAYAGAPDGSVWMRDWIEGDGEAGQLLAERMLAAGVADVLAA
jgi:hydroxymethylbilane synthase